MSQETVTDDDQGKRVVDADGEEIGVVTDVRGGTAYVDPDPGIGETISSKLGWADADEDDHPIDQTRIDTVTSDEIRLRRDL